MDSLAGLGGAFPEICSPSTTASTTAPPTSSRSFASRGGNGGGFSSSTTAARVARSNSSNASKERAKKRPRLTCFRGVRDACRLRGVGRTPHADETCTFVTKHKTGHSDTFHPPITSDESLRTLVGDDNTKSCSACLSFFPLSRKLPNRLAFLGSLMTTRNTCTSITFSLRLRSNSRFRRDRSAWRPSQPSLRPAPSW